MVQNVTSSNSSKQQNATYGPFLNSDYITPTIQEKYFRGEMIRHLQFAYKIMKQKADSFESIEIHCIFLSVYKFITEHF